MAAPQHEAGIWQTTRKDGPQKGGRLIQIRNATGLCVELLPDRCLDIGQVWLHDLPFAWMGPWGLPSKGAGVSMDNALGGLMATCGFDHIRQPVTHAGHDYPLHGTMALTPCTDLTVHQATQSGGDFIVEATTHARAPDGAQYTLNRRLIVPLERNEISLEDRVSTTPTSPVFALYHVNTGASLIGEGTCVTLNNKRISDHLAAEPQVQVVSTPDCNNAVKIVSPKGAVLELQYDGAQLPWLQTYRRAQEDVNLFCLEPVSHDRIPRAELLATNSTPTPLEQSFSLRFSFFSETAGSGA